MRLTAGLATRNQPLLHRGEGLASIDQHCEKGLGIAQRQVPCIACRQGLAPRPHQIRYQRLTAAACGEIHLDATFLSTARCSLPNTHLDPRGPGAFHLAWEAQAGRLRVRAPPRVGQYTVVVTVPLDCAVAFVAASRQADAGPRYGFVSWPARWSRCSVLPPPRSGCRRPPPRNAVCSQERVTCRSYGRATSASTILQTV